MGGWKDAWVDEWKEGEHEERHIHIKYVLMKYSYLRTEQTKAVFWGRYFQIIAEKIGRAGENWLQTLMSPDCSPNLPSFICQKNKKVRVPLLLRPGGESNKGPFLFPKSLLLQKTITSLLLKPLSGLTCFPQRDSLWSHQPWVLSIQISKQYGLQTKSGGAQQEKMEHLIILFLFEFIGNLDKHLCHIVLGKLWAFPLHSIQPDGTTGCGCHTFLVPLPVLSGKSVTCCPWGF